MFVNLHQAVTIYMWCQLYLALVLGSHRCSLCTLVFSHLPNFDLFGDDASLLHSLCCQFS